MLSMWVFTTFHSEHALTKGALVVLPASCQGEEKETLILGYQNALIRMMIIFILLSHFPCYGIDIISTLKCYVLLQPKSRETALNKGVR